MGWELGTFPAAKVLAHPCNALLCKISFALLSAEEGLGVDDWCWGWELNWGGWTGGIDWFAAAETKLLAKLLLAFGTSNALCCALSSCAWYESKELGNERSSEMGKALPLIYYKL